MTSMDLSPQSVLRFVLIWAVAMLALSGLSERRIRQQLVGMLCRTVLPLLLIGLVMARFGWRAAFVAFGLVSLQVFVTVVAARHQPIARRVRRGRQNGPVVSRDRLDSLEANGAVAQGEDRRTGVVEGDRRYIGVKGLLHGPN